MIAAALPLYYSVSQYLITSVFSRWITDKCANVSFVLKSDDDQVVDTLQLPTYLDYFVPNADRG